MNEDYKLVLKSDEQQYDTYIILADGTRVDTDISNFKIIYNLGEKLIGNFATKMIEFSLFNTSNYNITNQEFEVFVGLKVNGQFSYRSIGKYIADKPVIKDEALDECTIKAHNYYLKFRIKYTSILTFPITIENAIKDICEYLNITYMDNDFINKDYILNEFFIDEDATFYDVIKILVESGFANAVITNENKLIVKNPSMIVDYKLSLNELFDLKSEDNKFGPLNSIVASRIVADDGSTTEDVYAKNDVSIAQNGLYEYKIIQNDAIDYDRQTAVNNILSGMLNFSYVPATIETVFNPFVEIGNMFEVPDKKTDTSFLLFAKEINIDLATGLMTIESTEDTKTETDYKSATNKDKRRKTEAKVNKLEGKINFLTEETSENTKKIAEQEITVDGISQRVNSVETEFLSEIEADSICLIENTKETELPELSITPNTIITDSINLKITNENMLKNKAVSNTIAGVSFEINEDKSITLNGTAIADIEFILNGSFNSTDILFFLKSNQNYFKCGLSEKVLLNLYNYDGTKLELINSSSNGDLLLTKTKYVTCTSLKISKGTVFENETIYPMLQIGKYSNTTEYEYVECKENDILNINLQGYLFENNDNILILRNEFTFTKYCDDLYPSDNLYPSEFLYPGEYEIKKISNYIKSQSLYDNKTLIQCDKDVSLKIKYFLKDYLNEKFATIEVVDEKISLQVNEKLENYSTTEEMNSAIELSKNKISLGVSEKFTNYSTTEEMNKSVNEKLEEYSTTEEINNSVDDKLKNYSTTTEMNSAIDVKADSITNSVSSTYATKNELSTAKTETKQTTDSISSAVSEKVGKNEFSTYIAQNAEAVKVAWNTISEFIQMMNLNGNASLAILDDNKNFLMALDKIGQHFYDNNNVFAEMKVTDVKDGDYKGIMFVLNGTNSGTSILPNNNFMGFGYKAIVNEQEVVIPFLYLGKAYSDDANILHILSDVDVQGTITAHIINNLTSLSTEYAEIGELQGDYIKGNTVEADNIITTITTSSIYSDDYLASFNNKDGTRLTLYADTSDKRMKKNIKETTKTAMDYIKKIKHFSYDWKNNNQNVDIGYVAQELEKINPQFVRKNTYKNNGKEDYEIQVNTLNLLATVTKAIQEQQEEIEMLKEEIEKLKEVNR